MSARLPKLAGSQHCFAPRALASAGLAGGVGQGEIQHVLGNCAALSKTFAVAIIGTRRPTEYGSRVAHRFGLRCAEQGAVVVSGLAVGCDTLAHRGWLEGDGRTVAVMARGGVYLAGGVTQRLLPLLPRQRFLDAFNAKAEHADLVRTFPVHVVTDPDIGLHGAYAKAI